MHRRRFLASAAAALAAGTVPLRPYRAAALDLAGTAHLQMPPLLDTTATGRLQLAAMAGQHGYGGPGTTPSAGFNQPYLGPTIRMANGPLAAEIENTLSDPVSVHWHGLMVPGQHDGGPLLPVLPGQRWAPDMQISQDPATVWYHSHIHGQTAPQVYAGLAGVIQLTDGRDDQRGLPSDYGTDDLTLVLQDRRFDAAGRAIYDPGMMDIMHGFAGNAMTVNGQTNTTAVVPQGIVRLRLLNGSNARVYSLFFEDNRPMHLVATDSGYLPAPIPLQGLTLAPGERAELLVDFAGTSAASLLSDPGGSFVVQDFATDDSLTPRITRLPETFDSAPDDLTGTEVRTRKLSLDMGMGGMMGGDESASQSTASPTTCSASISRCRSARSKAGSCAPR